ncbi:MAG TPA: protein kinase [Steroidobacteraceae bacterium]
MQARLLIVDRDLVYAEWLRRHLGILCPDATVSVLDMREVLLHPQSLTPRDYDLLILCAAFADGAKGERPEGVTLLRELRTLPNVPAAIMVAVDGDELTAVRALRLGALDYLPKRLLTPQRLHAAVRLALKRIERRVARNLVRLARASAHGTPAAAAADPAASPALAGAVLRNLIPQYEIRATIGESEKAVVYLAASLDGKRDVALKVSKKAADGSNEPELLAREHAALNAIQHPAIVEIYDYGACAGHEYLAMEYFARGDLKARLHCGLGEEDTLRYVQEIAAALRVVHEAGILHRDLKPANVMLRENDDVVLIDFGLARQMDAVRSTRTGLVRGSPYYMSPEQALGEELDVRSDLYSLGIIYFELLTGKRPYGGLSAMEVLEQHVNAPLPRLPERLAQHTPLLSRMLAKARDARCNDATEVVRAVAAHRSARARRASAA